jgi:nucleoside-diphosphate-sugar epimerase
VRPDVAAPSRRLEQSRSADPAPALEALGWQPRVSLREGLAETVAWYSQRVGAHV